MRHAVLLFSFFLLGGCGLRPVYSGGASGEVAQTLRAVTVAPIEGQSGWLVRNKLVDRLGESGRSQPAYRLDVTLDDNLTSFGIRGDRAATRERRTLRARYQLVNLSTGLVVLDATAGSDAGIDIVSSEYATVAAEQTALENLAGIVADQIVARLASFAGRSAPAMKAGKAQIGKLIDQPSPDVRFYLFWGADEAQSRGHAMRLLRALGADRFIVISNVIKSDPAALADEAGALALFGGKRVIWIEPAGDDIRAGVAALLEAPTTESPVVAIVPSGNKPRELIKLAESSPLAVSFAAYAPEGQDAERMVVEAGRRVELNVSRPIAARVANACGNDQAIVAQEMEKFALYLDASTSRPRELDEDVIEAVGANLDDSDFLHLSDLAMSGKIGELAEALGRISSGSEAIPVLRALQRRILLLAPARARVEAGERPDGVMASLGKALFWKDKQMFGAMLSRWSAADLEQLASRAAATEKALLFSDSPEREALGEELLAVGAAARRR